MIRKLSVVIPAFNEAAALRETLAAVVHGLPTALDDAEVVVIDDGSTDSTAEVVREAARRDRRVRSVAYPHNAGKGRALRIGLSSARHEWVLLLDADHQVRIDELAPLMGRPVPADAVIGYRTGRRDGPARGLMSLAYRSLVRWALAPEARDVGCPFKLIRRDVVRALPLTSEGFLIDAEIVHRLRNRAVRTLEIPVAWHARARGRSTIRGRHVLELLRELAALRREPRALGTEADAQAARRREA